MSDQRSQSNLKAGQVPLDELPRVKTAHDVRTLRHCGCCGGIGNSDSMIKRGAEFLHGRCFVDRYGKAALRALPSTQTDCLTLGDLGVATMKYLAEGRSDE